MRKQVQKERCPTCGKGHLAAKLLDLPVRSGSTRIVVHDVLVQACDSCDEEVIEASEIQRAKEIARVAVAVRRRAA